MRDLSEPPPGVWDPASKQTLSSDFPCSVCGVEIELNDHLYSLRGEGLMCMDCASDAVLSCHPDTFPRAWSLEQRLRHIQIFDTSRPDRWEWIRDNPEWPRRPPWGELYS